MEKKGFTLIELLAVIVILSIILLIAVPIVLKVINDSKKATVKDSLELYGRSVEQGIANYFMKNPEENGVSLEQLNLGNYIQYKGTKVECNDIRIVNRKVYLADCKVGTTYIDDTYGSIEPICKSASGTGSTERGTEYSCEVEEGTFYTFYVLGEEDDKVNLIMDRNICEDGTPTDDRHKCTYAWYSVDDENTSTGTNIFGPITAMQKLYSGTKDWSNISNINLTYDNLDDNQKTGYTGGTTKGYKGIQIENGRGKIIAKDETENEIELTDNKPIKARMPKLEEIYNRVATDKYCSNSVGSCPSWITTGTVGYWTLAANPESLYQNNAFYVTTGGIVEYMLSRVYFDSINGVRPVITVPKSDLN